MRPGGPVTIVLAASLGMFSTACGNSGTSTEPSTSAVSLPSTGTRPPTTPSLPTSDPHRYDAGRAVFDATWRYETQLPIDLNAGEALAFRDGTVTCDVIKAGKLLPGEIHDRLRQASGWTDSGAAAVVAAAVRGLCPEAQMRYTTQFDFDVSMIQTQIKNLSGVDAPTVPTGEATKRICNYLGAHPDIHGLWDLMVSEGTPARATIKAVVRAVVGVRCPAYNLGGFWYNTDPGPPPH